MVEQCTFFRSFFEAFEDFDDADRLALYDGVMRYVFNGSEPSFDGVKAIVWKLVKPNVDKAVKRSRTNSDNAAKTTAKTTAQATAETVAETVAQANPSKDMDKDKDKDKERDKEVRSRARFAPPTLGDVDAYAKGYAAEKLLKPDAFSAERFIDYYSANGWKVGRNPMRDWKAAVRDWVRRDCEPKGGAGDEYSRL